MVAVLSKISKQVELTTERLILKTLDEDFAFLVLDYYQRNKEHFKQWVPDYGEEYFTLAHQQKLLGEYIKLMRKGLMVKLWLFEAENDGLKIIGDIAYTNIIRGPYQGCHLGYKMDKDYLRLGYMSEALKLTNQYVFQHLQLHRIEANIMPFNQNSIELIEKLGFKKEGFSDKYLKINGKWENHVRYGMINEEMEE